MDRAGYYRGNAVQTTENGYHKELTEISLSLDFRGDSPTEVLACTIRANPTIKGVTLPGATSALPVLSQYADDTSLVLSSDQSIR